MRAAFIDEAIELLEKSNADLEPELLGAGDARALLESYARAQRLAAFGVAALTRKVKDATVVARMTGTSIAAARETVETGDALSSSRELDVAFRGGELSLSQANEISKAERSAPGSAEALVKVAKDQPFHVLKDRARKTALEAEQHRGLAERQRRARSARSYSDELGMIHMHLTVEPHRGAPMVARAEAEAQRLARRSRKEDREPFERYLADAYLGLLSARGPGGPARRPELVVLVSHGVARRGWTDVEPGEVCKIPGLGPISPQAAREIAEDAFLSGVFYDGTDLRQIVRWTRHIPVEVALALELGDPPDFDGIACVDCGNRFRTEFDHVEPRASSGPTSNANLDPRCWGCHQAKTARDRRNGKLGPRPPNG